MSDFYDGPETFYHSVLVADEHIDTLGHCNNNVYSQWCESTAWLHCSELGLAAADYQHLQRAMAIQQARYDYMAPSFSGDRLRIATCLTGTDGRITLQRSFEISNENSGDTVFRGCWDLVCINLSTHKPCRMPKEFKDGYLPHVRLAD